MARFGAALRGEIHLLKGVAPTRGRSATLMGDFDGVSAEVAGVLAGRAASLTKPLTVDCHRRFWRGTFESRVECVSNGSASIRKSSPEALRAEVIPQTKIIIRHKPVTACAYSGNLRCIESLPPKTANLTSTKARSRQPNVCQTLMRSLVVPCVCLPPKVPHFGRREAPIILEQ